MNRITNYTFRSLISLSDDEIRKVVTSIYDCNIKEIQRDKSDGTVTVYAISDWNGKEMEDTLHLEYEDIWSHDFAFSPDEIWKYKQYLFALGVNLLAKDNQFLSL